MSTVSMSIVGSYMKMIDPKYVVTALVLNLFSGFIIVHIINPYEVKRRRRYFRITRRQETNIL